jgi:UDP-N-acetylmuramoyl-L-alanyl-D-glutamate--2,6-diaminopimelate ligase
VTIKKALPLPPILVAGMGRAGEAALKLLTRVMDASTILAWDVNRDRHLQARAAWWRARGVKVTLGGDGTDVLRSASPLTTVVKSPGIDPNVPLLRMAEALGLDIVDELEIGWRALKRPIVAVTGTNGKSTTCALIASVFQAAGHLVQVVGNTEFGAPLSAAMVDREVVCEVSSFQLETAPSFLPEISVFTNLSLEHMPRHGTMSAYGDVKQLMFVRENRTCGLAIVNADDARGRQILAAVNHAGGRSISYGFSADADVRILDAQWTIRNASTLILLNGRAVEFVSKLPGRYNAHNIAAACAFGCAAGFEIEAIQAGISGAVAPPGRFEVINEGQSFDLVVDYAHTPDGISQFLAAARAVTSVRRSSLRTVFGAVGLPDHPKAQGCGEAARSLSDQLILTTGSAPRSFRILRLQELRDAARPLGPIDLVLDRRQAIEYAIDAAGPGDVVAILGLGALKRLVLDASGTRWPFDDRETARNILRSRHSCAS